VQPLDVANTRFVKSSQFGVDLSPHIGWKFRPLPEGARREQNRHYQEYSKSQLSRKAI
jgi:hypothetical protein